MGLVLIYNAKVVPVSAAPIADGAVLVDGGRIAAVGRHLGAPDGAETLDARGMVLTPGLIDAHTHVGTAEENSTYGLYDYNEKTNPVTPALRIADAIYPREKNIALARDKGGVTCAQTLPGSSNVLCGSGAVIKLKDAATVDEMLVRSPSCMKAALGENPIRIYKGNGNRTPTTRMGNAYLLRKALQDARDYADKKRSRAPQEPFSADLDMEALLPVLERKIKLSVHAHRSDDICTAVRIAEEFGLDFTIEHCTEGKYIADYLAQHGVKAAFGPTFGVSSKPETRNKDWETLLALARAGVHTCIITDHPVIPLYGLATAAAWASREGLSDAQALRCITLSAAEHLGLDGRIGSIEPGKDADLVLWSGDPLDVRSRPMMVMIDGKTEHSEIQCARTTDCARAHTA